MGPQPAESLLGLGAWLAAAGLASRLREAEAWCEDVGAVELAELLVAPEELCDALALASAERERFLAAAPEASAPAAAQADTLASSAAEAVAHDELLRPRPLREEARSTRERDAALAVAVARARRHLFSAPGGPAAAAPATSSPPGAQPPPAAQVFTPCSWDGFDGALLTVRISNPSRSPSALGVSVDHGDGATLRIEHIAAGGLLEQWNRAHPNEVLSVGDRIIGVNGKGGDAVVLINTMSRCHDLELVVRPQTLPAESGAGGSSSSTKLATLEPLHVQRSEDGAEVAFTYPAGAAEESLPAALPWFRVVLPGGLRCRLRPDHTAAPSIFLEVGEVLEAILVRGAWAKLSPAELQRHGAPSCPGKEAEAGDCVRALTDLAYGGVVVPAGSFGIVVSTLSDLGVRWLGFDALSDAVVYPGQVATLRQVWVPLRRPPLRGLHRGAQAGPALVEAPRPPKRVLDEGGVVKWAPGGMLTAELPLEQPLEPELLERTREVEEARLVEHGAERVVVENDMAWELLQARRRSGLVAAAARPP